MKSILLRTIIVLLFSQVLMASNGEKLYQKCLSCHGTYAEKRALGKSKVVQKMDLDQIIEALSGYQKNTYGGPMKTLMQEQVKNLSEDDIKNVSEFIVTLKSLTK